MNGTTQLRSQLTDEWLLTNQEGKSYNTFLGLAHAWAEALPDRGRMILLCEEREHFIIAFIAAQLAGQTVLLPSSRVVGAIEEIAHDYPDSYCLVDHDGEFNGVESVRCSELPATAAHCDKALEIAPSHLAAIVFTSGSTGRARPNEKRWSSLVTGAHLAQQRFGFTPEHSVVATVPSQHMYGLETTVMVPLIVGTAVHSGRPFFPADVCQALAASHGRRVLITTPVHLRACVKAGLEWPEIDFIISATAPLSPELLQQAQQTFAAPLFEIYGCTEAGSLASRQPAVSEAWQLYDTFQISGEDGDAIVTAPHLGESVELGDVVEIREDGRFCLRGRKSDLVNVAGKRASLNDLNLKLNAIPGVVDGQFIVPEDTADSASRLAALVVAPGLQSSDVTSVLAQQIDPVFLPRPLHIVDSLPRNETGKLPRQALLALLQSLGR